MSDLNEFISLHAIGKDVQRVLRWPTTQLRLPANFRNNNNVDSLDGHHQVTVKLVEFIVTTCLNTYAVCW